MQVNQNVFDVTESLDHRADVVDIVLEHVDLESSNHRITATVTGGPYLVGGGETYVKRRHELPINRILDGHVEYLLESC